VTSGRGGWGPSDPRPAARDRAGHELSPLFWISAQTPPTYIVQGDADPLVPDSQARRYLARAKEVGSKAEVLIRLGGAHGGWVEMADDNVRMAEWFSLHLLGQQPAKAFNFDISSLPSTPTPKKPAKK
jgi:acetyl esterase/lipase